MPKAKIRKRRKIVSAPTERRQVAALCYTGEGADLRILLVTSRDTGRWVLPKGWPMDGLRDHEAAAREAWEEAGIIGDASDQEVGTYGYLKRKTRGRDIPCRVSVYPVAVEAISDVFPEKGQRTRGWFTPAEAADLVHEPELASIFLALPLRK